MDLTRVACTRASSASPSFGCCYGVKELQAGMSTKTTLHDPVALHTGRQQAVDLTFGKPHLAHGTALAP